MTDFGFDPPAIFFLKTEDDVRLEFRFIARLTGTAASLVVAAPRQVAPPPLSCTPGGPVTPAQTEGPFYKSNTPERTSLLEPGMTGTRVIVTGYVVARDCTPIVRTRLDFWQADDRGNYDNAGFRLRGHQCTDDKGIYYLETILPGLYPGRTRHIHVKVQAPGGSVLTTQLYFPGESSNQNDRIFDRALLAALRDTPTGKVAAFNFILDVRR
ncbi:MAG: dioxygenase [Armatimonadetes bacterium]|nr:dioxygenase [Armatimonadota bacterium]